MRSPICWFGGKGNMVAKLLPLIPRHHIYAEVFGGGASLMMAKQPSNVEVYNDIDLRLTNLFRVLRCQEQFEEFNRLANLTAFSREEFRDAKARLKEGNSVEQAWRFFVTARQSFAGNLSAWGYGVTSSARGMAGQSSKWLSTLEMLPEIHARLMRTQIECDDWRKVLRRYDTPETLFYLDPPYVPVTRRSGNYQHELTELDHVELVEHCLTLEGRVLLSGYPSEVYKPLEASGWKSLRWETVCHAAGRTRLTGMKGKGSAKKKQPRIEAVWMNYSLDR